MLIILDWINTFRDLFFTYEFIIVPIVFLSFFLFGFIAIHKKNSRKYYLTTIVILLLISSILALQMFPFTHAHRFTDNADQNSTANDIRMVDSGGDELMLDARAVKPLRDWALASKLADLEDNSTRIEMTDEIMEYANIHRAEIESSVPRWRHPPPSVRHHWDRSTLDSYNEFESIRVYNVETIYSQDSAEIHNKTQECLIEINPHTETIVEGCNNV